MDEHDILAGEPKFIGAARKRGCRDPEDVAGKTMARLWEKQRRGDRLDENVVGLVLHGYIVDDLRHDARTTPWPFVGESVAERMWLLPGRRTADTGLFVRSLRESLRGMDPDYAKAWALVNILGYTIREAAGTLGISPTRTYERVELARQRLAKEVYA